MSPIFLFPAALLAGIINGVAGGGSLIAFPLLLIAGVPPLSADATNTAGLWFGKSASTIPFRKELQSPKQRRELFLLSASSVIGGVL